MKKYLKLIPGKGLSKTKPTCENEKARLLSRQLKKWPITVLHQETVI